MRITAKNRTQVRMHGIVHPGETIDLEQDRIDERIRSNFVPADGSAWPKSDSSKSKENGGTKETPAKAKDAVKAKDELVERTAKNMGREAIISALESSNVAFSTTENTKNLARKYLRYLGEDV